MKATTRSDFCCGRKEGRKLRKEIKKESQLRKTVRKGSKKRKEAKE
jgi:hypothetical protein